jgi:hypothetical protein
LIAAGAPAPRAGQKPSAWLAEALAASGARRLRHPGCIRYAFRLGETRRERAAVEVALPAGPYPKSEVLVRGRQLRPLSRSGQEAGELPGEPSAHRRAPGPTACGGAARPPGRLLPTLRRTH